MAETPTEAWRRGARLALAAPWMARLAAVALGLVVLSGCYIPTRFTAQININGAGE
jgi:hypothetical protein